MGMKWKASLANKIAGKATNPTQAHQFISKPSLAKKDSFISTSINSPVFLFLTVIIFFSPSRGALKSASSTEAETDSRALAVSPSLTSDKPGAWGLSSAENIKSGFAAGTVRRGVVKAEVTASRARRFKTRKRVIFAS